MRLNVMLAITRPSLLSKTWSLRCVYPKSWPLNQYNGREFATLASDMTSNSVRGSITRDVCKELESNGAYRFFYAQRQSAPIQRTDIRLGFAVVDNFLGKELTDKLRYELKLAGKESNVLIPNATHLVQYLPGGAFFIPRSY